MEAVSPNATKLENPTFCNSPTLGRQFLLELEGKVTALEGDFS